MKGEDVETTRESIPEAQSVLDCYSGKRAGRIDVMKINTSIGMILLAVYLIVDGLLGFGLNLGPGIFLLYLVGVAAGIFILIGK